VRLHLIKSRVQMWSLHEYGNELRVLLEVELEHSKLLKEEYVPCSCYVYTAIITVVKSVARIRLVKTEIPRVCVTVNCKVCRPVIELYYL
jgi:hypothetical protein